MGPLFLDLGGTIVDMRPNYHEPIFNVLRGHGVNVSLKDVYRAISRYLGDESLEVKDGNPVIDVRRVLALIDKGLLIKPDVLKDLESLNFKPTSWSLYNDTLEFLNRAKGLGYRLYIISNASKNIYNVLQTLNITGYFDGVVASFEVGAAKPSMKIFMRAAEIAGGKGPYIGDLYEVDYLGAKRAGFRPILLDRNGFYSDVEAVKVSSLLDAVKILKNEF